MISLQRSAVFVLLKSPCLFAQKSDMVEEEDELGTQPDRHRGWNALGFDIPGPGPVHVVLQPQL